VISAAAGAAAAGGRGPDLSGRRGRGRDLSDRRGAAVVVRPPRRYHDRDVCGGPITIAAIAGPRPARSTAPSQRRSEIVALAEIR